MSPHSTSSLEPIGIYQSVADPVLELSGEGGGEGGSFVLIILPAFLSCVTFFFFYPKIAGGSGPPGSLP